MTSIPLTDTQRNNMIADLPNLSKMLPAMGIMDKVLDKLAGRQGLLELSIKQGAAKGRPCVAMINDIKSFVEDNEPMMEGLLGLALVNDIKNF